MNYLQIFELPPTCTIEEISVKYKSLAKKYHPDRKGGDEEKMKLLNASYEFAQKYHKPVVPLDLQTLLKMASQFGQMQQPSPFDPKAGVQNRSKTEQFTQQADGTWIRTQSMEHFYRIFEKSDIVNGTIRIELPVQAIEIPTIIHCMIVGEEVRINIVPKEGQKMDLPTKLMLKWKEHTINAEVIYSPAMQW